ncbi:MAG: hypothetical protein RL757_398 [Bacteroidota bacterium]|jgi:7-keto-8-aminopelargonate synthetase-like enzyme
MSSILSNENQEVKMNMKIAPHFQEVNRIVQGGYELGIGQLVAQDDEISGSHVQLEGKDCLFFGSCGYLALELDPRLKQAAADAAMQYGTMFSSSRAYMRVNLYDELESLFEQIFGFPCLVSATTTLGHTSVIPTLIGRDDAVILDHQVHASVQTMVQIAKANGTHVELVRHNRMDMLEERIKKLRDKHEKIWYMADGVYSMYGDLAPMKEIGELLDRYDNFYAYLDDAHGMSWTGTHGNGYVLSQMPDLHDKMILLTSLAKGFGACGGVMVFKDPELRNLVRNCGRSLMFSGPVPPPILGAAIASAKIHLTPEIVEKQEKLADLMRFYVKTAKELHLPLVSHAETPIGFIGVGQPETGYKMSRMLIDEGFYVNLAVFPSVPIKNTGLRMTLSLHQTRETIHRLLHTIAILMEQLHEQGDLQKNEIQKAFSLTD